MATLHEAAQAALHALNDTPMLSGTRNDLAPALEALRDALARSDAYAYANPFGGPASVFRAAAERIEAGEDYDAVLIDYGLLRERRADMLDRDESQPDIGVLVDRFLSWPLPGSVRADPCACYPGHPNRSGSNLLTAVETRLMLLHVLRGAHACTDAETGDPGMWVPVR